MCSVVELSDMTVELLAFIKKDPDFSGLDSHFLSLQYQKFVDVLSQHNHLYYVDSEPIISDYEYDQLFAFLKKIEEEYPSLISSNSPTQALVSQLSDGFLKADHKFPLLSLENSYDAEDLGNWNTRCKRIIEKSGFSGCFFYRIEPKFDGLSVEIVYKDGKLIQAITRGDGQTGEDITMNIRQIKNLPKQIIYPEILRLRGEIMMPKSQFEQLNQQRMLEGLTPFSNTRNAASGSIKLLDSKEVEKRGLLCFVYDILEGKSDLDLRALSLPVFILPNKYREQESIEKVIATCQDPQLRVFLQQQDYDFDGLVIKLCDKNLKEFKNQTSFLSEIAPDLVCQDIRSLLGATEHHPRRAIAYKYPAQQIASKILSVDFQVGRTGIITPVANLTPVSLSGATISRVSLHNFDFIIQKQIKNGDYVWVQRSGEVIPYILGPITTRRDGSEEPILPPMFCPECQSPVTNIDIHYYCTNSNCPGQIREKLLYFVSRDAMDIIGFGDAIIQLLVEQKILTSIADLYRLLDVKNQVLLRKFPSFGEKKVSEMVYQLEKSKHQPLRRLLNGLGISNIGKKTAQDLVRFLAKKRVSNLDMLIKELTDIDQVSQIYGVGDKVAQAIQHFFSDHATLGLLRDLEGVGLNFSAIDNDLDLNTQFDLDKLHFSITGTFPLPRTEIINQMQELGYIFDENLLQTTHFVLMGERAGSKAEKAHKYGLKIYNSWKEIVEKFSLKEEAFLGEKVSMKPIQGGLF